MHYSLGVAGLGHPLVGCVGRYTDLVGCVLGPVAVSRGRLTWIPVSRHSCWVYHLVSAAPLFRGMPTGFEAFFGAAGRVWTHLKKALCHCRPVGGKNDEYQLSLSSQQQFERTLLSAVLTLLFSIYVLFIQYTCSTCFLFFLAPNRPQQKKNCF